MLWLFKINFHGFRRFGNSSYVVLYTQCLNYNICSAWFLDIRIAINLFPFFFVMAEVKKNGKKRSGNARLPWNSPWNVMNLG